MSSRLVASLIIFLIPTFSFACGPEQLGTSRVLEVDPLKIRSVKGKEKGLGLKHKEVILTFDDGPIAGKTPRILQALKNECVKATFFYVGRMAKAYPRLVRKVVAQGHTLAHHTHSHNRLPLYSSKRASQLIDQGIKAVEKVAYGESGAKPRIPFFRYPYLARNKTTDKVLASKGLVAFGANIDSRDWKSVSAKAVHNRIMKRLRSEGRGIILMHDIQARTAKMLPGLLKSLKAEGYKVVHIVPKGAAPTTEEPVLVASVERTPSQSVQPEILQKASGSIPQVAAKNTKKSAVIASIPLRLATADPGPAAPLVRKKTVITDNADDVSVEMRPQSVSRPKPFKIAVAPVLAEKIGERQIKSALGEMREPVASRPVPAIQAPVPNRAGVIKSASAEEKSIRQERTRVRKITRVAKNWKLRRSNWIIR